MNASHDVSEMIMAMDSFILQRRYYRMYCVLLLTNDNGATGCRQLNAVGDEDLRLMPNYLCSVGGRHC